MILLLWLYSKNCDVNPRITSLKSKLINGKKNGDINYTYKIFPGTILYKCENPRKP